MASLCQFCEDIVPLMHQGIDVPISHHRTVGEAIAFRDSCVICSAIQRSWPLASARIRFPDTSDEQIRSITIDLKLRTLTEACTTRAIWGCLEGELYLHWQNFSYPFSTSIVVCMTNSKLSLPPSWCMYDSTRADKKSAAKVWLDECEKEHPECTPFAASLPIRLLRVGENGHEPQLVATEEMDASSVKYATLSHCWGDTIPLRTTMQNVHELMNCVPLSKLPPTFRDAVDICHSLHIPYVWIDSLCIVQDDLEEWHREAGRMKDIYANSVVTIAASDALNSSGGCFAEPSAWTTEGFPLAQFQLASGGDGSQVHVRAYEGDFRTRISHSVLNSRGWVMQEQILSHRIIHFMQPEIQWECRRLYRIENGVTLRRKDTTSLEIESLPILDSSCDAGSVWRAWMTDYSRRVFTFSKDWFNAVAGVVDQFAESTGNTHLLACWKETLLDDLAWIRIGGIAPTPLIAPGIPSWTWLSRCYDVDFRHEMHDEEAAQRYAINYVAKVVRCEVHWHGLPLVSEIKHTFLELEGPVRDLHISTTDEGKAHNPPYFNIGDDVLRTQEGNMVPWHCTAQFDLEEDRTGGVFTCLVMKTVGLCDEPTTFKELFLLLECLPYNSEGIVYRRVGMGSLAVGEGRKSEFEHAVTTRIRII